MHHPLTDLLLAHRASGELITDIPDNAVPQTADDAYRVQNETIAALGPVGAWKIQPMPETGLPFASPILASTIKANGSALRAADFAGLGIEVEVAVILNRDLPALPQGYGADDMPSAIASVHVALEILGSRFIERTKVPQLVGIADLQSGGSVVLGPAMPAQPLPEFGQQGMVIDIDGTQVASTDGNATTANMMTALAWLANHAAARGLPLAAGTVIITGARLGPVPLTGKKVEARADKLGVVSVTFD